MSTEEIVIAEIQCIADEYGVEKLAPLTRDLILTQSGLDSLSIAILVARLEDVLGFDPFAGFTGSSYPVTLGDFIALYENAGTECKQAAGEDW